MTKARTLADNFAADINGITAGTGITGGGTSGTVTVTNSMATAIDAKGDLVVGTGADTFSRLAVASTAGYLLSVDSAEATGLKWAAPAAGGGMTLLATTSMSGSATATVSGISGSYKKLVFYVQDFYPSGSTSQLSLYLNGQNSTTEYYGANSGTKNASGFNMSAQTMSNNSGWSLTNGFANYLDDTNGDNFLIVEIDDYANTTTKKVVNWKMVGKSDTGDFVVLMGIGWSVSLGTSAVSSASFNTNSGTWTAGTIYTYGVN